MFCTLAEYYLRFKEYSVANKQKDIFQKNYAQIMQFIFTNIYHMQLNSRWIDFHLLTHITLLLLSNDHMKMKMISNHQWTFMQNKNWS